MIIIIYYYFTHSQYADNGPTSPSADPVTPGAWQVATGVPVFKVTSMTRPGKISTAKAGFEHRYAAVEADALH